jgi:hypothetical protein
MPGTAVTPSGLRWLFLGQTALLLSKSNALTSGYVLQDTFLAATVRYTSVRPGLQKATDRRTPGHGRPGWERLR